MGAVRFSAFPAAGTLAVLYTVPEGREATINFYACNQGAETPVYVALAAADTPVDGEFVEFAKVIGIGGVIHHSGWLLPAGTRVVVKATAATVGFTVLGVEGNA